MIVSKGPQHDQLELAPNMVGEEFLPQTSILPQVDLVITHGGNNTVTECLHFGKPMVVLPLFWDQYDNAQRIDETGYGRRLDTYAHEPDELRDAIAALLADEELRARLATTSRRLQGVRGTERAADLIESLVEPASGGPAQAAAAHGARADQLLPVVRVEAVGLGRGEEVAEDVGEPFGVLEVKWAARGRVSKRLWGIAS